MDAVLQALASVGVSPDKALLAGGALATAGVAGILYAAKGRAAIADEPSTKREHAVVIGCGITGARTNTHAHAHKHRHTKSRVRLFGDTQNSRNHLIEAVDRFRSRRFITHSLSVSEHTHTQPHLSKNRTSVYQSHF